MPDYTVDFSRLASLLGDDLTPDFLAWFSEARFTRDQLYGFVEYISAAFAPGRAVRREPGELVPHLPMSPAPPPEGHPAGVDLYPRSFFRQRDLSSADDALRRHFLYCHRIVMDNPVLVVLSMARHPSNQRDSAPIHRALTGLLTFLMEWREAIEAFQLQFVDPTYKTVYSPLMEAYAQLHGTKDFQPPSTPLEDASLDLLETMELAREVGASVSLYLPTEHHKRALEEILAHSLVTLNAQLSEHGNIVLRQLLSAQLPRTEGLTTRDIVAIRRDDEQFEQWRAVLRSALLQAQDVSSQAAQPEYAFDQALSEEMKAASMRLLRKARRSPALAPCADQFVDFAVGGIEPSRALSKVGLHMVGELPRALMSYIWPFAWGPEGDALTAHFMTMLHAEE